MPEVFHLYDDIRGEILGPLAEALSKAKAAGQPLEIKLNTYGGDTNAGFAAHALITQAVADGVKVSCDVIAICASAGTYILLACPVRRISSNASVMIHEAEAWAAGRADELATTAEIVERVNNQMVELYSSKTKLSADEVRAAMAATTYYTAQQALANGFVTEVYTAADAALKTFIRASLKRSQPLREAAIAAAKEHMTLDEILAAVTGLSAEDQSKVRAAVAGAPEVPVTSDESALGETVVKLAGVPVAEAAGVVLAWKTAYDVAAQPPAVDPVAELEPLFEKHKERVTPHLRETITAQVKAGTIKAAGADAWLARSPVVLKPTIAKAAAAPVSDGAFRHDGKTYAEWIATPGGAQAMAKLKREEPATYEALRTAG